MSVLQEELTDNQIVLQYFLGVTQKFVLIVSKNNTQLLPLTVEDIALQEQVATLRKSLSDYLYISEQPKRAKEDFKQSAYYFYKTFVEGFLNGATKGKHLIIIPDGVLGHVPFEVFLAKPPKQKVAYADLPYLIRDYSTTYSYSASIFMYQQKQSKKRVPAQKGILAFAADYSNNKSTNSAVRSKRGGDIASLRERLASLLGAREEVQLLQKYLYGSFFNGTLANEKVFKETAMDYNIILSRLKFCEFQKFGISK